MGSDSYTELVDKVVNQVKIETDNYVKENIDPVAEIPSPDKLVGHGYPFNQLELETLKLVYVYDQKPLTDYIAKMAISELNNLEEEVRLMEV